jgi:hypothetical protein
MYSFLLRPEFPHKDFLQVNYFVRSLIQREMSRIENMHLGAGHVLAIRFGASHDKRGIISAMLNEWFDGNVE